MAKFVNLFLSTVIIFLYFSVSQFSFAHILDRDDSMGVVIHIDPDDDPIVGEGSTFFFEYKDKENKFQISNCNCFLQIYDPNNEKVFDVNLLETKISGHGHKASNSETAAGIEFVFDDKGVYKIKLNGNPKDGTSFKSFSIEDTIRVERVSKTKIQVHDDKSKFHERSAIHLFFFLFIAVAFVVFQISNIKEGTVFGL